MLRPQSNGATYRCHPIGSPVFHTRTQISPGRLKFLHVREAHAQSSHLHTGGSALPGAFSAVRDKSEILASYRSCALTNVKIIMSVSVCTHADLPLICTLQHRASKDAKTHPSKPYAEASHTIPYQTTTQVCELNVRKKFGQAHVHWHVTSLCALACKVRDSRLCLVINR